MNGDKKNKFILKTGQIIFIVVAVIVIAVMVTIDCLSGIYKSLISSFLGCAEQIDSVATDKDKIDASAKSGDQVVRNIGNEGVVLMKNDGILPLPKEQKKINIFGWGATEAGFLLVGNGSGRSFVHEDNRVSLLKAFREDKFEINEEIIGIYENWRKDEDKDWGDTADWGNRYNTKLKEPVTATAFPDAVINRAKASLSTASAPPAGTCAYSAASIVSEPKIRISSFNSPQALP